MAGRKPRTATAEPDAAGSVAAADNQPAIAPTEASEPAPAPAPSSDPLPQLTAERDAALALVNEMRAKIGRISAARDTYRAVANQCIAELDYWHKTTGNEYPKRRRTEISKELAEVKDE